MGYEAMGYGQLSTGMGGLALPPDTCSRLASVSSLEQPKAESHVE